MVSLEHNNVTHGAAFRTIGTSEGKIKDEGGKWEDEITAAFRNL